MKNSKLFANISLIILATAMFTYYLVKYIMSFEIWDDGFGTDYSFNSDYVVLSLIGLIFLIYAIYNLVTYYKNNYNPNVMYATFALAASVGTFYPLGVFFKAMAKGKAYVDYQDYFYIALASLVFLCFVIFTYLSKTNKKIKE